MSGKDKENCFFGKLVNKYEEDAFHGDDFDFFEHYEVCIWMME